MGRNIALFVAVALFWAGVRVHTWWRATHSPTAIEGPAAGVKPQDSGDVTPVDPTSDPAPGKGKSTLVMRPHDLDAWLAERAGNTTTNALVREAARRYRVSASTVKRALRRVRDRSRS